MLLCLLWSLLHYHCEYYKLFFCKHRCMHNIGRTRLCNNVFCIYLYIYITFVEGKKEEEGILKLSKSNLSFTWSMIVSSKLSSFLMWWISQFNQVKPQIRFSLKLVECSLYAIQEFSSFMILLIMVWVWESWSLILNGVKSEMLQERVCLSWLHLRGGERRCVGSQMKVLLSTMKPRGPMWYQGKWWDMDIRHDVWWRQCNLSINFSFYFYFYFLFPKK